MLDLSFIQNIHMTFDGLRVDRFAVVFGCMLLLATVARMLMQRMENRESQATSFQVGWYALQNDRVTRKMFAYALFGFAALPISYVFQPHAVRQILDVGSYSLGILQGSVDLGLPPELNLHWQGAFYATLAVMLLACTWLCYHRHQRRLAYTE